MLKNNFFFKQPRAIKFYISDLIATGLSIMDGYCIPFRASPSTISKASKYLHLVKLFCSWVSFCTLVVKYRHNDHYNSNSSTICCITVYKLQFNVIQEIFRDIFSCIHVVYIMFDMYILNYFSKKFLFEGPKGTPQWTFSRNLSFSLIILGFTLSADLLPFSLHYFVKHPE